MSKLIRYSLFSFAVAFALQTVPLSNSVNAVVRKKTDKTRLQYIYEQLEKELQPYADDLSLDEIAIPYAGQNDFDLIVLGDNNPMISDECYKLALLHAAGVLKDANPDLTTKEALEQGVETINQQRLFARENGRTYGEFFRQIVQCEDFCLPLVAGLEQCHVEAVAALGPRPILFDAGSSLIREDAIEILDISAAEALENTDHHVLLVGRASFRGDKLVNRRLSYERTLAVQHQMMARGVPERRTSLLWLGWEPPQITQEIAAIYGIGDVFHQLGAEAANESVMIVVYPNPEGEPLSQAGQPHDAMPVIEQPESDAPVPATPKRQAPKYPNGVH